jgi:tetratricopeptide (TPR) repeat protein
MSELGTTPGGPARPEGTGLGSTEVAPRRAATWVAAPVLVVLVVLAYWPVTDHGFVNFDDPLYITDNPHVCQGLTTSSLRWAFNVGYAGTWQPLAWLSHMLDVELFGLDPGRHHLGNVLLHALSAFLVFRLLRRLMRLGFPAASVAVTEWVAVVSAGIFAFHPQRIESVAWACERKDVLSMVFGLLTILAYVRYAERRTPVGYAAVVLLLALGLMAKPMLVSVPLLLLLLDYWPLGRLATSDASPWAALRDKLPLGLLVITSSWITIVAQSREGALSSLDMLSTGARLANASVAYFAYLVQFVWPLRLSVFYPLEPGGAAWWQAIAASAALLALTALVLVQARRRRWLVVGWLWYGITLFPVIGVVQIGMHARADRFTYLPHIGLILILASAATWLAIRHSRTRPALAVGGGLLLLLLILGTRAQLGYWHDSIALFERAAAVTNRNYVAHTSLSIGYSEQGRQDLALEHAREAVRIRPNYYLAHDQLGSALAATGRTDEGLAAIREALRLRPGYAWGYFSLGTVYLQSGRHAEAIDAFERAIELQPDLAEAWANTAIAHERSGDTARALQAYDRALTIDPQLFEARLYLGALLAGTGDIDRAISQLERATVLRPDDPRPQLALALIDLDRGERGAAEQRYRTLLELDSSSARRLRERLDR